jgi:hypothetical protein
MAKEGGGWGAYMAKGGPLRPLWPKEREGRPPLAIPHLRGAYMAKEGEGSASLFGHPLGCLHGQREGGRGALRPLWPSPTYGRQVPTWPSSADGAALMTKKRDGHPFGQTPPFGPDGQKSVWPSLWPSPTGWAAPLRPKGAGGGPLPTA